MPLSFVGVSVLSLFPKSATQKWLTTFELQIRIDLTFALFRNSPRRCRVVKFRVSSMVLSLSSDDLKITRHLTQMPLFLYNFVRGERRFIFRELSETNNLGQVTESAREDGTSGRALVHGNFPSCQYVPWTVHD